VRHNEAHVHINQEINVYSDFYVKCKYVLHKMYFSQFLVLLQYWKMYSTGSRKIAMKLKMKAEIC
jgi:hypothetical protein